MFLTIRSPFGGRELRSLWCSSAKGANVKEEGETRPQMVGDYLAWKIGYAQDDIKKGEGILVKRSDAEKLWQLLRVQFGN